MWVRLSVRDCLFELSTFNCGGWKKGRGSQQWRLWETTRLAARGHYVAKLPNPIHLFWIWFWVPCCASNHKLLIIHMDFPWKLLRLVRTGKCFILFSFLAWNQTSQLLRSLHPTLKQWFSFTEVIPIMFWYRQKLSVPHTFSKWENFQLISNIP